MLHTLPFAGYSVVPTWGGLNGASRFYEVADGRTPTFAISAHRRHDAAVAEAARLTQAHAIEVLSDALDRAVRIDADTDTRAWIKADNRLLDACIDAGMAYDDVDHRAWASDAVAAWLSSGREAA